MGKGIPSRMAALFMALAILYPGPVRGAERYYSMVFGSQSSPKRLRYTHTWATFIRVVGEGDEPRGCQVYVHTISWLPATGDVRVLSPVPEQGVNLDLYATLDAVYRSNENVTMWGPFELAPQVYARSLEVKAMLESGAVRYRAISTARDPLVSDCIHAVAAIDPVFGRGHYPLIRIGNPASRFIARQVMTRSIFDQYRTEASWLIPTLGLDRYPIEVIAPQFIPKQGCLFCRCPE